jgi:5-methylcytosine-specific restriction protein B
MLNLNHYQSIFDIDDTSERCKQVLEQIEPKMRKLLEQFISQNKEVSLDADQYSIHSYAVTLRTTYHDAQNPKYAEDKKDSNIGRKYFIQIMKRVGDLEINALTLEFNGLEKNIQVHIETNFYSIWSAVRMSRLSGILSQMSENVSTFIKSSSYRKVERNNLEETIKSNIKPRKRPWFYFGLDLPLTGEWNEEKIIDLLHQTWEDLRPIREFLEEEKKESYLAKQILNAFATDQSEKEQVQLLQRDYTLTFGSIEQYKTNVRRQTFYLYDNQQMVVKGKFYYYDFHEKYSPYQTIALNLEGHNHIFTSVRELLAESKKEWWIKKAFSLQSLNNEEVQGKAMQLIKEHNIDVRGNEYYISTYDKQLHSFIEPIRDVKAKLAKAALLFAHVSEKIILPEPGSDIVTDDDLGGDDAEHEFTPSFDFNTIYQTIQGSSFTFSKENIRDMHLNLTSLDDKHFTILSGISGTGKTQLCRLYANAVYGLEYDADNPYLTIIPVRPDWTDSTSLFGYYSSFEQTYVVPEFLQVILHAQQEREKPHFIVLDELNLARVEYYLSDYLSAVESRKKIPLHNRNDLEVPKHMTIPPNIYVMGTINVDETTHSISDKVLDRAYVMTLSKVDFETFFDSLEPSIRAELHDECTFIQHIHGVLSPYHLHFGYRTMNEMIQKLYHNLSLEEEHRMSSTEALDKVLCEKVLPKIRGDESISLLLEQLGSKLKQQIGEESIAVQEVDRMKKELERYGATQFWR